MSEDLDLSQVEEVVRELYEMYHIEYSANFLISLYDDLIAEVKRLRQDRAEAKRTQVKDGGRGQLRPFPEPDREE